MATYLTETTPTMGALEGSLNVNARITGAAEAQKAISQLPAAAKRAILKAYEKEAWKVIRTAQQKYVPVDTGRLAFSGMVLTHPGKFPTVEFGFGGEAKHYAVVQHETTWFQHPAGGGPFFLSLPTERAMPGIIKRVGEELRAEFRKFDTRRFM